VRIHVNNPILKKSRKIEKSEKEQYFRRNQFESESNKRASLQSYCEWSERVHEHVHEQKNVKYGTNEQTFFIFLFMNNKNASMNKISLQWTRISIFLLFMNKFMNIIFVHSVVHEHTYEPKSSHQKLCSWTCSWTLFIIFSYFCSWTRFLFI